MTILIEPTTRIRDVNLHLHLNWWRLRKPMNNYKSAAKK